MPFHLHLWPPPGLVSSTCPPARLALCLQPPLGPLNHNMSPHIFQEIFWPKLGEFSRFDSPIRLSPVLTLSICSP